MLAEMVLWAARHEETGNQALVRDLRADKEKVITAVRQKWANEQRAAAN